MVDDWQNSFRLGRRRDLSVRLIVFCLGISGRMHFHRVKFSPLNACRPTHTSILPHSSSQVISFAFNVWQYFISRIFLAVGRTSSPPFSEREWNPANALCQPSKHSSSSAEIPPSASAPNTSRFLLEGLEGFLCCSCSYLPSHHVSPYSSATLSRQP